MICFTFNFYWWKGSLHFHFLLVKKVCFTFTFYRWKMAHTITFTFTNGEIWSASLSLSMGEIWSRQLLLFSPELKYELTSALWFPQSLVAGTMWELFDSVPLYRCRFSLWRLCVYQCWLLVVIDDSLGRVGHESQNLRMWFSEHVMVRKDHNVVIFNLVNPPLWEEELSHNKLMHKV